MAENENIVFAKELRLRNDAELSSLLQSKAEELHGVKFKHTLGQLTSTHAIKSLRRDIARIKTVLHERTVKEQGEAS